MCPSVNLFNVLVIFIRSALFHRKSKALSIQPVEAKLVKKRMLALETCTEQGQGMAGPTCRWSLGFLFLSMPIAGENTGSSGLQV